MKITAIIPARFASTRFPGKPLVKIAGKAMIERVYERVLACKAIHDTIIATDDKRIFDFVEAFGGKALMTSDQHQSGTDRIAEVAARIETDVVVNVQGDEPFITSSQLEQLVGVFENEKVEIATLVRPIDELEDLHNPNVVKAVISEHQQALYFSRSPVPFLRDVAAANWLGQQKHFQHLGLYAYRKNVLLNISQLPPSPLEQSEALEQLRWLEAGYDIHVTQTQEKAIGVDTPADVKKAEEWLSLHSSSF